MIASRLSPKQKTFCVKTYRVATVKLPLKIRAGNKLFYVSKRKPQGRVWGSVSNPSPVKDEKDFDARL